MARSSRLTILWASLFVNQVLQNISELMDIVLIAIGFSLAIKLYQLKDLISYESWPEHFVIFFIYLMAWIIGSNIYKVYQSRRFMSAGREISQVLKTHFFSLACSMILINLYIPDLLRNRFFFLFWCLRCEFNHWDAYCDTVDTTSLAYSGTQYTLCLDSGRGLCSEALSTESEEKPSIRI